MNHCCCRQGGCSIYRDNFNDSATETNWDERAGVWARSSGLLVTSADTALIVTNETVPSPVHSVYSNVRWKVDTSAEDDFAGIAIIVVDDDNFWWAKATAGDSSGGTLELIERSGGTDTVRASIAVPWLQASIVDELDSTNYTELFLCFATTTADAPSGTFQAVVSTTIGSGGGFGHEAYSLAYQASADPVGTKAGLLAGGVTGQVWFDEFSFSKHRAYDSRCPVCFGCVCDHGPEVSFVQVELSGVVAVEGACPDGNCDPYNMVYILPRAGDCCWQLDLDPDMFTTECFPYNRATYTTRTSQNLFVLAYSDAINPATCSSPAGNFLDSVWGNGLGNLDTDCTNWNELELDWEGATSVFGVNPHEGCGGDDSIALVSTV